MQVRFERHTERLTEIVRVYGDGLGSPELGRFDDHIWQLGYWFEPSAAHVAAQDEGSREGILIAPYT